jgi:Fe2+ or Zn2+ uptake regulation protein
MTEKPRGKVFDPTFREETFEIVARSDVPIGVSDVVRELEKKNRRAAWATARSILLELGREGKITVMRTSSNLIFWVEKEQVTTAIAKKGQADTKVGGEAARH